MNPRVKKFFLNLAPFLVFAIAIVGVSAAVKISRENTNIESKAAVNTPLVAVNMILQLTRDPKTAEVTIEKAVANTGYPRYIPVSSKVSTDMLEQITNGQVTLQIPITYSEYMYTDASDNQRIMLDKPTAYVIFPYTPGATLQVRKQDKINAPQVLARQPLNLAITNMKLLQNQPSLIDIKGAATSVNVKDGFLDIVFISNDYGGDFNNPAENTFHTDTDAMIRVIRQTPPFSKYLNNIRFNKIDNSADLGCAYDKTNTHRISCDLSKVYGVATQVPWDKIVVVENNDIVAGAGYADIAITSRNIDDKAPSVALGELAHTFDLADINEFGGVTMQSVLLNYFDPPTPSPTLSACEQACLKTNCSTSTKCVCGTCVIPTKPLVTKTVSSVTPVPTAVVASLTPTPVLPSKTPSPNTPVPTKDCIAACKLEGAYCPQNTYCDCGGCVLGTPSDTPIPVCAPCDGISCTNGSSCVCGVCVPK
jgi:hypothetical protein